MDSVHSPLAAPLSPAVAVRASALPLALPARRLPAVGHGLAGSGATRPSSSPTSPCSRRRDRRAAAGVRLGFAPLRRGPRDLGVLGGVRSAFVARGARRSARRSTDGYPLADNLVTAAKFAEYALLALAAPLLLRTREELTRCSSCSSRGAPPRRVGALLQFLGVLNEFEGRRPGQREPSFLGIHDLAALSGATLAVGLLALALGERKRLGRRRGHRRRARRDPLGRHRRGRRASRLAGAAAVRCSGRRARARDRGRRRRLVAVGTLAIRALDTSAAPRRARASSGRRDDATDPEATGSSARRSPTSAAGSSSTTRSSASAGRPRPRREHYEPYLDDARARFPDLPERALPVARARVGRPERLRPGGSPTSASSALAALARAPPRAARRSPGARARRAGVPYPVAARRAWASGSDSVSWRGSRSSA